MCTAHCADVFLVNSFIPINRVQLSNFSIRCLHTGALLAKPTCWLPKIAWRREWKRQESGRVVASVKRAHRFGVPCKSAIGVNFATSRCSVTQTRVPDRRRSPLVWMRIASLWANTCALHAADVFTRKFYHSIQSGVIVKSRVMESGSTPIRIQSIVWFCLGFKHTAP